MKHFKPHPSRRMTDSWAWAYAAGTCEPPLSTAVGSRQDWIDASCDLLNGEPYEFERLCERLDAFEDFCTVPDDGRSFDEWLEGRAMPSSAARAATPSGLSRCASSCQHDIAIAGARR